MPTPTLTPTPTDPSTHAPMRARAKARATGGRAGRAVLAAALPLLALAACGGGGGGPAAPVTPPPVTPTQPPASAVRGVHDPVVAKENGVYWLFHTGDGVPVRRSTDLVTWETAGRVFPTRVPGWASTTIPGVEFPWAPDIVRYNGKWHLYYSLSTFGSQRSAIGVATNATLDPSDPRYRWDDQGLVLESRPGVSAFNAIDPNVALDADGQPWITWGSFWGGLMLRRLDAATGKLATTGDTTTYNVAARSGLASYAIEAPTLVREGEWYYLFASYDFCCRGAASTYHVRVGRARQITGPYVDRAGVPLREGGGTVVLEGSGRVKGPGHQAVLADGDRRWLVHHFYDEFANGVPTLQVRPLTYGADGWPTVGEPITPIPASSRAPAR